MLPSSYLRVDLFEVVVVLVDLEVDLGGRDGDLPGHRHARRHQHRGRAYVDRTCGGEKYVMGWDLLLPMGCVTMR